MKEITLISTIHKDMGKCNSNKLLEIIKSIKPDAIFLEALDSTYSRYDQMMFNSYGIIHKKLEIQAIQKYSITNNFEYIPVLDNYLLDSFNEKFGIADSNNEIQDFIDYYNRLIKEKGFDLLNSEEGISIEEEQRRICDEVLNNHEIDKRFDQDINQYENSMLTNIYSYCNENHFDTAIFMCGVGHRKSIIHKLKEYEKSKKNIISWKIYKGKKL